MDVSEPTARKAMNELRGAGLVMQERRGQGRSNKYHLLISPKDSFVQERKVGRVEEDEKEKHQEMRLEDSIENSCAVLSLDTREVTEEPPKPPRLPATPLIDEARMQIFAYIKDLSRELHDSASLTATTTRAVNIFHRSGVSMDQFQDHLLSARQITQERSVSVKKVHADGVKNKTPYFFSVLSRALGLVESSQSSHSTTLPYPPAAPLTAYSSAYQEIKNGLGVRRMHYQRE
jgi:hypothetical protein